MLTIFIKLIKIRENNKGIFSASSFSRTAEYE